MKHTGHSKGCPNSHISTLCIPSGGNADVYYRMQMVKHLAPLVTIRQWLWQALEKEYVLASSCPIHVQLVRDLGIFLARTVVVQHEEHVALKQLYVAVRCLPEKYLTFLSMKWQ